MREVFNNVLSSHYAEKSKSVKITPNNIYDSYIRKEAPNIIQEFGNISNQYTIKGSAGVGNWSEIPWICVFDKAITNSAMNGYYIVYLFKADMSGFYIAMGLGWTQFKDKYGTILAREKIKSASLTLRSLIKSNLQDFNYDPLSLNGNSGLAKGYELGCFISKYYSSDFDESDKELSDDLRNMIGVYREIKGYVGQEFDLEKIQFLEDITDDNEDSAYQRKIQQAKPKKISRKPRMPKKGASSSGSKWSTDPGIARSVIEANDYNCTIENMHETFISKASQEKYVEAHHLIPMSKQEFFEFSLDAESNIVPLCANCHRLLHHGRFEDKKDLIFKLWRMREKLLLEQKIQIDKSQLCEYYE